MKCPECRHNQSRRGGMRCTKCGYEFVFDPHRDGFADGRFISLVNRVSANGTMFFTTNQLFAEWARRGRKPVLVAAIACGVLALAAVLAQIFWSIEIITVLLAMLAFGAGLISLSALTSKPPKRTDLERCLARWRVARGEDKHIVEPALRAPPPDWPEPDIFDYGVERILVVDRDVLVDLFVKNELHAEHRMLVVSITGYPDYLIDRARELIHSRADLPIFALHDASADGLSLISRITETFDVDRARVVDVGLSRSVVEKVPTLKRFRRFGSGVPVDFMTPLQLSRVTAASVAAGVGMTALLAESAGAAGDWTLEVVVGEDFG